MNLVWDGGEILEEIPGEGGFQMKKISKGLVGMGQKNTNRVIISGKEKMVKGNGHRKIGSKKKKKKHEQQEFPKTFPTKAIGEGGIGGEGKALKKFHLKEK